MLVREGTWLRKVDSRDNFQRTIGTKAVKQLENSLAWLGSCIKFEMATIRIQGESLERDQKKGANV